VGDRGLKPARPPGLFKPRTQAARFWNPYTQMLDRAALDRLHLRRLQALIRYAYARSPMYRRILERARVRPEQIRTMDDFDQRVPVIDKAEVLEAQAVRPPFGDALAVPDDFFLHRFQTSGSTGVPLHIPLTYYSSLAWGESWVYLFWAAGLRPAHTFYFPFHWGIFAAFWSAYMAVRRLGGTVVSGGGLDSKGRINQILAYAPDVVLATPTYALYLGEVAREMGVDLARSSVSVVIVSGEPGGSIPTTRDAIAETWGARVYELYGIAELGPTNPGCPLADRVHLCEDWYHALVVDAQGRRVADGEVGEHVVTSYLQHGQPLIKYRTHDLVRWTRRPCACGATWIGYPGGVLGRSDHMIVVKGVNVYPTAVEALLHKVTPLTEHYEVHVRREAANDVVTVKAEARPDVAEALYPRVRGEAEAVLKEAIGVTIGVEVLRPGSLPRYELKARRFIDERPAGHRWQLGS
jgi:phenylacetate-CoA ligase